MFSFSDSSLIQFKDYIPFIDLDLAKKTSGSFNNLADDECKPVRLNLFVPIGGTKISEISVCVKTLANSKVKYFFLL